MNTIISAYACEPNKGSEPEVGWQWVMQASKKYDHVTVITRSNNRDSIELVSICDNIYFIYYDLPDYIKRFKKIIGVQVYAYLWEIGSFFHLKKMFERKHFDLSQKVTFVSFRFPSFIWYFSKKFILGPIAGGETYPFNFLKELTIKSKFIEIVRTISQYASLFDPFVRYTLFKADEIIAVTEDTKKFLPKKYHDKTIIRPAISINLKDFKIDKQNNKSKEKRLLYVGRLLQLKGLILTLKALTEIDVEYIFTIVGTGPDEEFFKSYAAKNKLNVRFTGSVERKKLSNFYNNHDIFIFPSLHDSGGMVVLEAKAHGMKVITSSFGGPCQFVDNNDIIIKSRNHKDFIRELNEAISSL